MKQTIIPRTTPRFARSSPAANGTTVTNKVVYGSAAWDFTHSQDPNCTMSVVFSNVPWNCETPEIDPEGSAAEVEFSADDIGVAAKDGSRDHHHRQQGSDLRSSLGGTKCSSSTSPSPTATTTPSSSTRAAPPTGSPSTRWHPSPTPRTRPPTTTSSGA
ncbi:MAG: hypothetical protein ACLTYW_00105 [Collinsella sp.]